MKRLLRYLPYLPWTVWFNFRYLPLRQAVRLPILLRKPRLLRCGGRIRIEGPVHTGMVRLGVFGVSVYPDRGIAWECDGTVTFAGRCSIGNDSYVAVGRGGCLRFGRNFRATAALRAVCYHELTFGDDVLVGWDNTFCDTDFHRVKSRGGGIPACRIRPDTHRSQQLVRHEVHHVERGPHTRLLHRGCGVAVVGRSCGRGSALSARRQPCATRAYGRVQRFE